MREAAAEARRNDEVAAEIDRLLSEALQLREGAQGLRRRKLSDVAVVALNVLESQAAATKVWEL